MSTHKIEYGQDDKTIVMSRENEAPANTLLTDFNAAPAVENISQRLVFSAHLPPVLDLNISLNPLVAAAASLFSQVVHLRHHRPTGDFSTLKDHLRGEIELFEQRALRNGAERVQVISARYVLCTVVDEAVVGKFWDTEHEWSQLSLLSTFHNETFGGAKFFQLLDRLLRDPAKHLSMLELMFLCLSLGFEGKYRVEPHGKPELEALRDSLYQQIRQLRGEVPRALSPQWQGLEAARQPVVRIVPWWLVALLTMMCLTTLYTGFAWVLGEQREATLKPYKQTAMVTSATPELQQ
ncbi:type IVB secretion system protein IcmH/DotU [Pseudomonas typographi]|uniref:type IVB secretion system protein IcmH/DotU n=1 Tax=Pseudomonas typographi TaxID=2715964 RepID=UPI001688A6CA|nr:type IVB secretion system protein IcmH/DotU [Pseudomonas typographi]MBD1553202.1 DotU family type IV/VI secretion system protein [Pseudomonas typographi]MBD1588082.1 DotU family type IV/VI secretion system protein [Pseudomonas typographi]